MLLATPIRPKMELMVNLSLTLMWEGRLTILTRSKAREMMGMSFRRARRMS